MSKSNGALRADEKAVVREELAWGGLPAVRKRITAMSGDGPDLTQALRFANREIGAPLDEDQLVAFAEDADAHPVELAKEVGRLRVRQEARAIVAADGIKPPTFPTGTLADDLATPPSANDYTVEGLLPVGGNVVFSAYRKTGKTTTVLNLIKALADDELFLDQFACDLTGRIAYVNYELHDEMLRKWFRAVGIVNADRVASPLHFRGRRLAFWVPTVRDQFAEWLSENEVQVLILDPGARAWRGLVESENDNSQMASWTAAVDELKQASGVSEVVIPVHTGRAAQAEGSEHSRGATALEDWPDALWYLTKDASGTRYFRATGRDVEEETRELAYDEATRTLQLTGRTSTERRRDTWTDAVLIALASTEARAEYPTKTAELRTAMHLAKDARDDALAAAVAQGYVERKDGPRTAKLYEFTAKGRARLADIEDPS